MSLKVKSLRSRPFRILWAGLCCFRLLDVRVLYASKPPCDASEFGSVVVGFRSLLSDSMTSATAATAGIPDRTLLAEVESLGSSFDESNQLPV